MRTFRRRVLLTAAAGLLSLASVTIVLWALAGWAVTTATGAPSAGQKREFGLVLAGGLAGAIGSLMLVIHAFRRGRGAGGR